MKINDHKILIRVDAHKRIGMGHLYQMLTLSRYLREREGFDIVFVTKKNKAAVELIKESQFRINSFRFNSSHREELETLQRLIVAEKPKTVVVDLPKGKHLDPFLKTLKSKKISTVTFAYSHKKNFIPSDIVFNSSLYQKGEDYEHIKGTKYFLGLGYVIMPTCYVNNPKLTKIKDSVKKLMVCMGGSDHNNLTFPILKAIDKSKHEFRIYVVLSSTFFQKEKVDNFVKKLHHKLKVYYDLDGILDTLLKSDLAITAGGNTHIERMCAGIPGIVISQLAHQEASARKFAETGATLDLGFHKNVKASQILEKFNLLLKNKSLRERMSKRGKELVDGQGLLRVSKIIAEVTKGEKTYNGTRPALL